jgi:hypothetical protein
MVGLMIEKHIGIAVNPQGNAPIPRGNTKIPQRTGKIEECGVFQQTMIKS